MCGQSGGRRAGRGRKARLSATTAFPSASAPPGRYGEAAGRQPQERRTTSSVGTVTTGGTGSPRTSARTVSTARRPISWNGARTVVRDSVRALTLTVRPVEGLLVSKLKSLV